LILKPLQEQSFEKEEKRFKKREVKRINGGFNTILFRDVNLGFCYC